MLKHGWIMFAVFEQYRNTFEMVKTIINIYDFGFVFITFKLLYRAYYFMLTNTESLLLIKMMEVSVWYSPLGRTRQDLLSSLSCRACPGARAVLQQTNMLIQPVTAYTNI